MQASIVQSRGGRGVGDDVGDRRHAVPQAQLRPLACGGGPVEGLGIVDLVEGLGPVVESVVLAVPEHRHAGVLEMRVGVDQAREDDARPVDLREADAVFP